MFGSGNTAPVADAGADQAVIQLGSIVQLDGSASWDDDGDALTYSWLFVEKPAGSTAFLSDPVSAQPTFEADVHGTYTLKLVVSDGSAASAPDQVPLQAHRIRLLSLLTTLSLWHTPDKTSPSSKAKPSALTAAAAPMRTAIL